MLTEKEEHIFDLLVAQEESVGQLYAIYQNLFPSLRDFWGHLVIEEKAHADVLRGLSKFVDNETTFVNQHKFNVAGLKTTVEYLQKQIAAANAGGITAVKALATAFDIESSIIDKEFFEVISTDSAKLKREFLELRSHTEEHIKRVAAVLAAERARQPSPA